MPQRHSACTHLAQAPACCQIGLLVPHRCHLPHGHLGPSHRSSCRRHVSWVCRSECRGGGHGAGARKEKVTGTAQQSLASNWEEAGDRGPDQRADPEYGCKPCHIMAVSGEAQGSSDTGETACGAAYCRRGVLHGFARGAQAGESLPCRQVFKFLRHPTMSLSRQLLLAAQRSGSVFGSPLPVLAASPDRIISEALNQLLRHQPLACAAGSPPPAAHSAAPILFPMLSGFISSPRLVEEAKAAASASTSTPHLRDHPCGPIKDLLMPFTTGNTGTDRCSSGAGRLPGHPAG